MSRLGRAAALIAVLTFPLAAGGGAVLDPFPAPGWEMSEWINGDPGPLQKQRGKLVLIEFFQLWCPGCNNFSIPLFKHWAEKYGSRDDVLVVSIHSVFEGHDVQTPERLHEFVREWDIRHPVGIDAYKTPGDEEPVTMRMFEAEGSPHVVVVDKEGQVVFSHFGMFDPVVVEGFIDRQLKERVTLPGRGRKR